MQAASCGTPRGDECVEVFGGEPAPASGGRPAGKLAFVGPPLDGVDVNAEAFGCLLRTQVVDLRCLHVRKFARVSCNLQGLRDGIPKMC